MHCKYSKVSFLFLLLAECHALTSKGVYSGKQMESLFGSSRHLSTSMLEHQRGSSSRGRNSRRGTVIRDSAATDEQYSLLETQADAYRMFAAKGFDNAKATSTKTMVGSVLGGVYCGIGCMLALAVCGNMGGAATANPGAVQLLFAGLFSVALLFCLQMGAQLFAENTATVAVAYYERKVKFYEVVRSMALSSFGNAIGCIGFSRLCSYMGVLSGGAADMATSLLLSNTALGFGQTMARAVCCNWLICLGIFLSMQAKDMPGKFVGILLPMLACISIGVEHSVASMFLIPAGLLCSAGMSITTVLVKNVLPSIVGNAISGSLLVGALLSYMYGKVGEGQ